MSSGDMSAYIRGKMEERRGRTDYGGPGGQWSSPPQFMLDGFQRWAQTDKPARAGGEEKEGVAPARQGGRQMDLTPNGGRQMDLTGGISFDDVNQFADVLPDGPGKDFIKNVTDFGKKALPVAKRFVTNLKSGPVRELAVDIVPTIRPALDKVVAFLESIGLTGSGKRKPSKKMVAMVMASPAFKEYCEKHGGRAPPASKQEQEDKLERMVGMAKPTKEEMMKLKQAAKEGDEEAMMMLEKMSMKGMGVKEDIEAMNARTQKRIDELNAKTKAAVEAAAPKGLAELNAKTQKGLDELNAKTKADLEKVKPTGTGKRRGVRAAMRLLRSNGVSLKEARKVLEGGAEGKTLLERAKDFLQAAKAKYDWLAKNKKPIHQILESDDLNEDNPLGSTDIPRKIAGYMSKIGLGAAERAEQVRAVERGEERVSASARVAATGGRKPSAYALFVKEYARKNPGLGKDLMKQAAMAWKSRK
jgi:hypothetical protein